jgi:hypothetical protein
MRIEMQALLDMIWQLGNAPPLVEDAEDLPHSLCVRQME